MYTKVLKKGANPTNGRDISEVLCSLSHTQRDMSDQTPVALCPCALNNTAFREAERIYKILLSSSSSPSSSSFEHNLKLHWYQLNENWIASIAWEFYNSIDEKLETQLDKKWKHSMVRGFYSHQEGRVMYSRGDFDELDAVIQAIRFVTRDEVENGSVTKDDITDLHNEVKVAMHLLT